MNRTRTYAATAAAALAASAGLAAFFVPAGNAATTMTFVEHGILSDQQSLVDVNHNGRPDDGDQFLVAGTLTDSAGKAVGYDRGFCELINVNSSQNGPNGESECLVTLAIPGGQLTVQGIVKFVDVDTAAVTGGTGNYAGRTGSIQIHSSQSSNDSTLVITLQ